MRDLLAVALSLLVLAACGDPNEPSLEEDTHLGTWVLNTLDGQEPPLHVRTEDYPKCGTAETYLTGSEMRLDPDGDAAWRWVYEQHCMDQREWDAHGSVWLRGTWQLVGQEIRLSLDKDPPVLGRQSHYEIQGTFEGGSITLDENVPPFSGVSFSELEYEKQD